MANTILRLHVTDYQNHKMQGYLESPFGEGFFRVENSMQFFLIGDEIMDRNRMPQATAESRSFQKEKAENVSGVVPLDNIDMETVQKTFFIRVTTRQNNSWQGAIYTENKAGERQEKRYAGIIEITTFIEEQMQEKE